MDTDRSHDVVLADPYAGRPIDTSVSLRHTSAREAIRVAIAMSTDQLVAHLPAARLGDDPEGVHQSRVATRRLRSDLRTFGPLLDPHRVAANRAELSWLAGVLGAVRDVDVLAQRLDEAVSETDVEPEMVRRILQRVEQQRVERHDALVAAIDDPRADALLGELGRISVDPPTLGSAIGRARLRLPPLVRGPWRRLGDAIDHLDDEPSVAQLHTVRLAAKRVRYAVEAVEPVFGSEARRFARSIATVQDVLGDMNDASVAAAWLRDSCLDGDDAVAADRLAEHFDDVAQRHRHGWQRAYRRASRRRRRAWFE